MTVALRARVGTRWRFDVHSFRRLAKNGFFPEDTRVELLDGDLLVMPPPGPRHSACVRRLIRLFVNGAPPPLEVGVQDGLRLGEFSEVLPDLYVLRAPDLPGTYTERLPVAADTLLVVEVADSSLKHDRTRKLPLYARAGVPELWLVDVRRRRIEVYRDPVGDGYVDVRVCESGQHVVPQVLPGLEIDVADAIGDEPIAGSSQD